MIAGDALPFPSRCLTLLPQWMQAIAFAGKRLENRSNGVASGLATYRGLVGLSQSKTFNIGACIDDCLSVIGDRRLDFEKRKRFADSLDTPDTSSLYDLAKLERNAGKLWLVAEVVDVLPPERCAGDPWHVEGQHGIIMGKVYEVEPVACMGGQGAWRPQWCESCKMIVADSHGSSCKRCLCSLGRDMPTLNITRECEP